MSKKKKHKSATAIAQVVPRPQASGYSDAGASRTRRVMKGFTSASSSPQEDIDLNNYTLRQRSRMLYMSSSMATSAVQINRTKVVGTGLVLKSAVNRDVLGIGPEEAKVWQRQTEAEFNLWASKRQNCDALGLNNFAGIQQLTLKAWLMSGDVFALLKRKPATPLNPYTLRIHLIEADRISTPSMFGQFMTTEGEVPKDEAGAGHKIHDGVEVDDDGAVVAYWICNNYPTQRLVDKGDKWTRVLVTGEKTGLPNILHVMDSERPDQYRGVPYLAPVIETILQYRRYTESELMAALIQSFYTAWIETTAPSNDLPFNEVGAGDVAGVPSQNPAEENISVSSNEYELGPGTINVLRPGEKVNFGNPNVPTPGFDIFTKSIARQIGAALEIPADVLLKEFNSSYSASRGALLEAWEALRMRRTWLVDRLNQPIYETWLAEAVAVGRIKAPGFWDDPLVRAAWCGANWIGPTQSSLDPLKEAKADLLLASRGIKTYEQVTRERSGGSWFENVEQLKKENELLAEAGGVIGSDTEIEDQDDGTQTQQNGN